ncbi:MAG TPA: methionyl-tRNA formyltransferase [Candidatus Saccharimonadales bacterium]
MTKISSPIVFFGSGPVAAESLRLLAQKAEIEAVITKPRAPHHRGDVPVITVAEALELPVFTVSNRPELDRLIDGEAFKSRLGVLVDFGIIVSQKVIDSFPFGIVNSHFSLLPEWRGADPITFSILSGQRTTGVSLMLLTAGMDEGPILAYAEQEISETTTTPELTADLIKLSDMQLDAILPLYLDGSAVPLPQDSSIEPTYSRKLTKADGAIDWHKPAEQIEREIRAFIEWPKSYTKIGGLEVTVMRAHVVGAKGSPGTFTKQNGQLVAFCGEEALVIDEIKPAGKQKMTGQGFLAGYSKYLS